MKNLIELTVVQCTRSENFSPETKKLEPKTTKDGRPVYSLHYVVKSIKKIGELELEETKVEKVSSLIELKPRKEPYILECEVFIMEKKAFYRVSGIAHYKAA